MFDFNRQIPLFDKTIPITFSDNLASKTVNLVFRLLEGTHTNVSGHVDPVFRLEISDDNALDFLYYFDAYESSFHTLKHDLRLTFDFGKFPEMLIRQLNLCIVSVGQVQSEAASLYTMKLERKSVEGSEAVGKLTFVETNIYKETDTLILSCIKGDNAAVIMYLSARLSLALDRLSNQNNNNCDLTREKEHLTQELLRRTAELQEMKLHREREIGELKNFHDQSTFEAKVAANNELEELKKKHEKEFSEAKTAWETRLKELTETNLLEKKKAAEIDMEYQRLERAHVELMQKHQMTVEDRDKYFNDVAVLTSENKASLESIQALEKERDRLLHTIEAQKERIQSRDERIGETSDQIRKNDEIVNSLRDQLRAATDKHASQKEKIAQQKAEIKRLTDLSHELEGDIRKLQESGAKKNDVIRAQEAAIAERGKEIDQSKRMLRESQEETAKGVEEMTRLRASIAALEKELEQVTAEKNEIENVRNYLNAELDQQKFGNIFPSAVTFSAPPALASVHTSSISPAHARPLSTPSSSSCGGVGVPSAAVSSATNATLYEETYARTRKSPLNNPGVDAQYHSQLQTSHNALFNADNYLNNSPVTPKIPSRTELMMEHQQLSGGAAGTGEGSSVRSHKLSYGELKSGRNTVTPPAAVKLDQMEYYNTQPKYSSSSGVAASTSQRLSSDRSPPAKVTRSSVVNTVTPGSGSGSSSGGVGLKLTKDMLTSEEVFSEERKTSSLLRGKHSASAKVNPEMRSYEWNIADFA